MTDNYRWEVKQGFKHKGSDCKSIVGDMHGGQVFTLGVPSEVWCILTGESPVMAKVRGHVAWMAGGDGNIIF